MTRKLLMTMCSEQGIRCVEKALFETDLRAADGIFLTSTLRDISPVCNLDGIDLPVSRVVGDLAERFRVYCDRRTEEVYRPGIGAMTRGD